MSEAAPKVARPQRVLVVDDEPTTVALFARALRKGGFEVLTASDGEAGLDLYLRHRPDLTILDLHMPGMSGLEALIRIRQHDSAVQAPVLVCTANGAEESLEEALSHGANDYMLKPLTSRSMLARVNLHLKMSSMSRELSERDQKDAIAAMVVTYNHELNTPLAVVLAFLELLTKRGDLPGEAVTMIERTRGAAVRAVDIVRRIREASNRKPVKTTYTEQTQMIDLNLTAPDDGEPDS